MNANVGSIDRDWGCPDRLRHSDRLPEHGLELGGLDRCHSATDCRFQHLPSL